METGKKIFYLSPDTGKESGNISTPEYFTIFQDKLHSVNIQDNQWWAFSKTIQKISKITYTASRFSLLTSAKFAVNINRVTIHHNKEFTTFTFLFNGFITMCIISQRV